MSKQLAISASAAVLTMAAFVLSATPDRHDGSAAFTQRGAVTHATTPLLDTGPLAAGLRRILD